MELKRRNRISAEFSMASMTDIIFLLLIFFMITSSAISQSAIDVKLPQADNQNPNVTDPLTVSITKDGKYFIDDKEVPREQVEAYLQNQLQGQQVPSFTIRADENALHKDVVYLMSIAENHKYNIAIATVTEQ
ncbi:MAG: biopolymer transporter ExbD [Chryseobacterium sp.]|nr:MAG: biopolymer transporter ExbD [Chryseobacterium sp.]